MKTLDARIDKIEEFFENRSYKTSTMYGYSESYMGSMAYGLIATKDKISFSFIFDYEYFIDDLTVEGSYCENKERMEITKEFWTWTTDNELLNKIENFVLEIENKYIKFS